MLLDTEERDIKKAELLAMLERDESQTIGNKTLRNKLKLNNEEFFKIRDELVETGYVRKGGGKGGSTVLIKQKEIVEINEKEAVLERQKEKDIYEPLAFTLKNSWAVDNGLNEGLVIEITANQGSKPTGGKWSRPDITIVARQTYPYLKFAAIEVITFEVKPKNCLEDITGVLETASHSLFATKSYLMLLCEENEGAKDVENIANLCKQFGVGLILFSDPKNYDTFDLIIEPERKNPDLNQVNSFIKVQITQTGKEEILQL